MLILWSVSVNPFTQKHNRFYSAVVHLYQISGKVAYLSDFGILSVSVAFIHKDRSFYLTVGSLCQFRYLRSQYIPGQCLSFGQCFGQFLLVLFMKSIVCSQLPSLIFTSSDI